MTSIAIAVTNVGKEFNRRSIFSNISFNLTAPASLAITGRNGTGKSTLLKILAGLLIPTKGIVKYFRDGNAADIEHFKDYLGFVSPYLNLYDEFTAVENLLILGRMRNSKQIKKDQVMELLSNWGLFERKADLVGTYSSGMKQRLKYAFALMHTPPLLLLDEPTSNLDEEGVAIVNQFIKCQKQNGILILATNTREESLWCDQQLSLESI